MLKKLALIIPPELPDEEACRGRNTAELLAQTLRKSYDCSCICSYTAMDSALQADKADALSHTQRSYWKWHQAYPVANECFDAALATDGLHPWALAALDRLMAKRRFIWICDAPEDYLLTEDIPFFAERYETIDGVLCASEAIHESVCRLFPKQARKSTVIALPLDTEYYSRLAQAPFDALWEGDTADIFAVCRLDNENDAQKIPKLAAEWALIRPDLRWHIAGAGAWRDRLVREIVLNDVCETVELMEPPQNPAPFIAQTNAYLSIDEAGDEEAERMARAMGKTVLHLSMAEHQIRGIEACAGEAAFSEWKDGERLMSIIKEGIK